MDKRSRSRKKTKKEKKEKKGKKAGAIAVMGGVTVAFVMQNIWDAGISLANTASDYKMLNRERIPDPLLKLINKYSKAAGRGAAKWAVRKTKEGVILTGTYTKSAVKYAVERACYEYNKRYNRVTRSPTKGSWDMIPEANEKPAKRRKRKSKKVSRKKRKTSRRNAA